MTISMTILFVTLALGASVLLADNSGGDFAARKTEILAELDEHARKLQEHKACVSAAADQEGLKKCRETMKEWRHGERIDHLDKRKARLEERMKKLEERANKK